MIANSMRRRWKREIEAVRSGVTSVDVKPESRTLRERLALVETCTVLVLV